MRLSTKTLLAATALTGLTTLPALAQDAVPADDAVVVVVDQLQLGDVFADMTVVVEENAAGATAAATAIGNTSSAPIESGDVDYDAQQQNNGLIQASTTIVGGPVFNGPVSTVTTAYGNTATSSTQNGTAFHRAEQTSSGLVSAYSDIFLDGADDVSATTTAAANVSTYSTSNGANRGFQEQLTTGDVQSVTTADICCNNSSVQIGSTATGNTLTSTGATTTSYNGAVQQTGDINIYAESDIRVESGTSVAGSATASGNSATVHNEWGYATLGREGSELSQQNSASTAAVTTVSLDTFSGTSGATSYGVGNSALISNVGSDTGLFANQMNDGDIYSYASFDGGYSNGSAGYASSTAIGNAATATLCYTCGSGVLTGQTQQINSAGVTAYGRTTTTAGGFVSGAASAIGNSATYQSFGTDGGG